jgi:hypothetical protein
LPARSEDFCPHCGATFPAGRLACPECGSDASTGWRSADEIVENSIDLPDERLAAAPKRGLPIYGRVLLGLAVLVLVLQLLGLL